MKYFNQRGQATVEYTVVLLGVVLMLIAQPNVLAELAKAIKDVYAAFTYAISLSWFPMV